MMKKFIKIGKEKVEVSEELYKEYYKMDRRRRYLEQDVKVGRIDIDQRQVDLYTFQAKKIQ